MEILRPDGKPFEPSEVNVDGCPACGAREKDIEEHPPGFGGYSHRICRKCGFKIRSGNGS